MIEILSLPRRPNANVAQVKNIKFKSGLPINSLPGWESIPLNSKLPMLKCPGNQVIFSKNKIGQSFRHLKHDFDPSGRDKIPEYNPLHDSNLQTFYANERNLKRLRENGEITQNNDVICNLKDFNEYRLQLHKSQLYYILLELNRLEAEQHDRMLIANAEAITSRDHGNLTARQHSYTEILSRKQRLDDERRLYYQRLLQKTEDKFQRIAGMADMQKAVIEHKKLLNAMKMQQHWDVCNDLDRKHMISLKKLFQFKKDRLQKNLRLLKETRAREAYEAQLASWEKRLHERISSQDRMKVLLEQLDQRKKVYIENHREKYREKWQKIQDEIKKRARSTRRSTRRRQKKKRPKKNASGKQTVDNDDYTESFYRLQDHIVTEAVNAAIDIAGNIQVPFTCDDPVYKAAKFIMKNILQNFHKDLSGDKYVFRIVCQRVEKYIVEAKKFVIFRATQVIASARNALNAGSGGPDIEALNAFASNRRPTLSFCKIPCTIGMSSYDIHPLIDVKNPSNRTPTPAGSLASIVVDSNQSLLQRTKLEHLCRNDIVFIEHYVIKFKRELIVGVGKRVFAAIQCHFEGKIMDVRKELLELDSSFLATQMTKAILSHAVNPIDFESCLKLSVSAIASEIVWSLQKHLLKPERDPRGIVRPYQCCSCETERMRLCLYCHN